MLILPLINVQYLPKILFLAFKKSRNGQIHSYPLQIPNTQLKKKNQQNFLFLRLGDLSHPLTLLENPVSKVNVMKAKKKKKDMERINVK